jgi:hypothetical protein
LNFPRIIPRRSSPPLARPEWIALFHRQTTHGLSKSPPGTGRHRYLSPSLPQQHSPYITSTDGCKSPITRTSSTVPLIPSLFPSGVRLALVLFWLYLNGHRGYGYDI